MSKPVRLGLIVPLTGVASLYGREISRVASIAASDINDEGGVLGRPLELVIADDGSAPERAIPAAMTLATEGLCEALVGTLLSNVRLAVYERVAEPLRLPMLNYSFYEGSINSRYFFHFAALPNQQIEPMIPFIAERYGPKMYFAGNNYEWPRGSIHAARACLVERGGEALAEEYLPIDPTPNQVHELLDRVSQSGADVFVPYFAGANQVRVLREFAAVGLKGRMAVVMGHFDAAMASQLDPLSREGLYSSNTYFMSVPTERNAGLLRALAAQAGVTGIWPDGNGVVTNFSEGAYVCVRAFAAAVEAAGGTDSEAIVDALEHSEVDSAQGRVTMDPESHHAVVNSFLARCDAAGRLQLVESFGRIAPVVPQRYRSVSAERRDTTPSVTVERSVAEARAFQVTSAPTLVVDTVGRIVVANAAAVELFGYGASELEGLPVFLLLPPSERDSRRRDFAEFVSGAESFEARSAKRDMPGYRKDGAYLSLEVDLRLATITGNDLVVITARDLEERRTIETALRRFATYDDLTGLPNRSLISARLVRSLERAERGGYQVAVLLVDVDGLQTINDSRGHEMGDALLRRLARRLTEVVRPGDTVARLGGDEFLVLAERVNEPDEMSDLAQRLDRALQKPVIIDDVSLSVSSSIGIALHGTTSILPDRLIRQADLAMRAARVATVGNYRFFDPDLDRAAQRRLIVTEGLQSVIQRDELKCRFQPIVDISSRRMIGAELLLRWESPNGMVPPAEFIPWAESSGDIFQIGEWVLRQGCWAQAHWRNLLGPNAPFVSINVSPRQLDDPDFASICLATLAATDADPTRVVLEVTESGLMESYDSAVQVLRKLTAVGVRIAVDDFGTGSSSLAELAQLPVSVLKVDRQFVASAPHNERSAVVLEAIIGLGQTLGLATIAEGVETRRERDLLIGFGCRIAQGFLFGRPAEIDTLIDVDEVQGLESEGD